MGKTLAQATAILDKLGKELNRRQSDVETLTSAYDGDFRLQFASDNFRDYFAKRYEDFSDNWCGIVADAPHERLNPIGIRLRDAEKGDDKLWATWTDQDADALCDLAILDAIIAKRAYGLVWGNSDDEAVVTFEHPSQAIVGYDPETRERVAGAKFWSDDEHDYATLYLPDEVHKLWKSSFRSSLTLPASYHGGWEYRDVEKPVIKNPMGKVPLVELANRPRLLGEPLSDIQGTLAMQHAINLLWAQLFAVSDEATLGQRVILGAENPKTPVLDENGQVIGVKDVDLRKFRQDSIAFIGDPNAKAFQWQPANLKVFTDIVEIQVGHIAAQTRTPAHYLLIGGTIANVSGDAMKALETGLVKRTEEKSRHFGRGIRDMFELIALAQNDTAKAALVRGGEVLWQDVENRSDAQRADALLKKSTIGYPLRYLLELDGLPPSEVDRVMDMAREEALDPVLSKFLGKNLDTGGAPGGGQPPSPDESATAVDNAALSA